MSNKKTETKTVNKLSVKTPSEFKSLIVTHGKRNPDDPKRTRENSVLHDSVKSGENKTDWKFTFTMQDCKAVRAVCGSKANTPESLQLIAGMLRKQRMTENSVKPKDTVQFISRHKETKFGSFAPSEMQYNLLERIHSSMNSFEKGGSLPCFHLFEIVKS